MKTINRRNFLAGSAATFAGASGLLGSFVNSRTAMAADTTGYKALVCVFMVGGRDGHDSILPVDQASYNQLANLRSGIFDGYNATNANSSRNINNITALNALNEGRFGRRRFGLPSELSGLSEAFNAGDMAVVGNVGPIVEPTLRDDFERDRVILPPRLFSHNDQQATWQALTTEGARAGWGGRFADITSAADPSTNPLYSSISTGSSGVFLSGETTRGFRIPTDGDPQTIDVSSSTDLLGDDRRLDSTRNRLREFFERNSFSARNAYERDLAEINGNGVRNGLEFARLVANGARPATTFPRTGIGSQLQAVAQTISTRDALNVNRQVFFVSMGGFDSHSNQSVNLPGLQGQVSDAMASFRSSMIDLGVWDDVTMFTASDFGRTLSDNGDGSDHGWGNHHFVMGGSVRGQRIYGDIPEYDLASQSYTASRARLIPSTSIEQYAATMGRWFGLNESEINTVFPNLSTFSDRDLGFLNT